MRELSNTKNEIKVFSPVDGIIGDIKKIPDEVFANDLLGKSICIKTTSNYVYSPMKGKIQTAFPTGHAYGVTSKLGPSILVHIGIDTVNLEGKGFIRLVMQDDKVDINKKLVRVDWEKIKEAKASEIILTALDDSMNGFVMEIVVSPNDEVKKGDLVFKLIKT